MFELSGKVALVVGGAGYLGTGVSRKLAEQGAFVVVADVDLERAQEVAAEIQALNSHAKAKGILLDIASQDCVQEIVKRIAEEYGQLHVLVNLAYAASKGSLKEITAEQFDMTLHTNLTGAFVLAREAAHIMSKGGSIIMFSSMYARVAPDPGLYMEPLKPNPIDYGVAKAGIEQMVRYLAVHYGPRGIRVNAVAPGPFLNPNSTHFRRGPKLAAFAGRLAKKVPLARIGTQNEVAAAVVFLASDEAAYVTGHTLSMDGGWTIW